jgi:ketol-acid reductoisomerase
MLFKLQIMELLTAIATGSASGVATFVFTKAFETIVEKLTEGGIAKVNKLISDMQTIIKQKFKDNLKAEEAVSKGDIERITSYLQVMMDSDEKFEKDIKKLATEIHNEINIGKVEDNSSMTQINRDNSIGYQTKTGIGNTNIFGGTHYHAKD